MKLTKPNGESLKCPTCDCVEWVPAVRSLITSSYYCSNCGYSIVDDGNCSYNKGGINEKV